MISPYFGEFMIIPMPLEFSFRPCCNACAYCFSNLNGYKAKVSEQSVLNKLSNFHVKKDNASLFLKYGYALCMSNKTDPFCDNNIFFSEKFIEIASELNIDIAFQTKGNKKIYNFLPEIKKSFWYITISQDNDLDRSLIEPNAMPINERFQLINKLVEYGHEVIVGVNPFIPEWINSYDDFIKKIKDSGAYGIIVEGLHFSHEQKKNMTEKQKTALTPDIINRSLKKDANQYEMTEYKKICDIIKNSGLELWSFWNTHKSDIWEPYYEKYKCFPIITNFINYIIEQKQTYDIVTFSDFLKNIGGVFPNFTYKIDSYIMSIARNVYKTTKIPTYGTMYQLLYLFWTDFRIKTCPVNHPFISFVVKRNKKNQLEYIRCSEGIPTVMVNKKGFNSIYVYEDGREVVSDE